MSYVRSLVVSCAAVGLLAAGSRLLHAEDPAAGASDEAPIPWVKVWADAKAQAKKDGKDLLIDFTGSDWCGWCKRLEGEVFSKKAFLDVATKQYVFVFLDFPHDETLKAAVADPELNAKLSQEFGVEGFPTIVLATADGLPFGKTGYQSGGPEPYLASLKDFQAEGAKIKALVGKGKLEKADKTVLTTGFRALEKAELLGYPPYAWVLEQAEAADADGKLGMKPVVAKLREKDGLLAMVNGRSREQIEWEKIQAYLLQTKYLDGDLLFQASVAVGDWLLESQKKPAEAKVMFALPLRDPNVAGNAKAKEVLDARIKSADDALNPKPAEPTKPSEPATAPK